VKNFLLVMIMSLIAMSCQQSKSSVRVATFNIWQLSTEKLAVVENGVGHDEQIAAAAAIIQKVRPDILVINEIDHDYNYPDDLAKNARQFRDAYLNQGKNAIDYPYVFAAPCNTGIRSGMDFDKDGIIADSTDEYSRAHGNDCFGYGEYPGQYSMALLSKFPIDTENVRTFQKFLWKDLPNHHAPLDYYSEEVMQIFRLSSKSHWDVPVLINKKPLHIFMSHPTPPVFDGPEDRNGRRNFDEIKFWHYYIDNNPAIYDDAKKSGGFNSDAPFIIAGDLNANPQAEAVYENRAAISLLLDHPKIQETVDYTIRRNESATLPSTKETNTAQFGDERHVRIDYVLPSVGLEISDGGVYWPFAEDDPSGLELAEKASDHRLVWIDVKL
jgi:endonuclease/exonuclease/phosphatase family metal-dependent hydrolase